MSTPDFAPPPIESMGAITLYSGSEITYPCDRLAVGRDGEIRLMCVSGPSMAMKALYAFMQSNAKGSIGIADGAVMPLTNSSGNSCTPKSLVRSAGQGMYRIYRWKYPEYHLYHAAIVSKAPNFMACISDASLWAQFQDPRFTTPLCRSWIPYIRQRLVEKEKLRETYGFQTRCGVLLANTKELDSLVSDGLKDRELIIPEDD